MFCLTIFYQLLSLLCASLFSIRLHGFERVLLNLSNQAADALTNFVVVVHVNSLHSFSVVSDCKLQRHGLVVKNRAVAAAPQTPQLGGATLPKGAPDCLEGPEVASIQKQSFALRIALNGIFCAQILYISVLKFFAIVYFQTASQTA